MLKCKDISLTLETHSMENGGDVAPDKPWYQLGQVSVDVDMNFKSLILKENE